MRSVGCRKQTHKHWNPFPGNKKRKHQLRRPIVVVNAHAGEGYIIRSPPHHPTRRREYTRKLKRKSEEWNWIARSTWCWCSRDADWKGFFTLPTTKQHTTLLHNQIKFVVGRGISKATKAFALTGCVSWDSRKLQFFLFLMEKPWEISTKANVKVSKRRKSWEWIKSEKFRSPKVEWKSLFLVFNVEKN